MNHVKMEIPDSGRLKQIYLGFLVKGEGGGGPREECKGFTT